MVSSLILHRIKSYVISFRIRESLAFVTASEIAVFTSATSSTVGFNWVINAATATLANPHSQTDCQNQLHFICISHIVSSSYIWIIFVTPDIVKIFFILSFAWTAHTSPPSRYTSLYLPIITPIPELSMKFVSWKSKMTHLMWFSSISLSDPFRISSALWWSNSPGKKICKTIFFHLILHISFPPVLKVTSVLFYTKRICNQICYISFLFCISIAGYCYHHHHSFRSMLLSPFVVNVAVIRE